MDGLVWNDRVLKLSLLLALTTTSLQVAAANCGGVMGRAYTIARVYPVSAQTLWADILDPNALAESMKGAFSYFGLPSEPVFEGQRIVVSIKRWGWFPMGKWTMDVVKRDDERYILESREFGSLDRAYRHRLEVETLSEHESPYTDYLDLDAGLFTDLIFPTFVSIYENRHQQRLKRLLARNSS